MGSGSDCSARTVSFSRISWKPVRGPMPGARTATRRIWSGRDAGRRNVCGAHASGSTKAPDRGVWAGPDTSCVTLRVTTQGYSKVLRGTQGYTDPRLQLSDQDIRSALQGEGRGFEPLNAHKERR